MSGGQDMANRGAYRHADLARLLNPQSVAIVGASPRPGSFGLRVFNNMKYYTGRLYQINPRYEEIAGAPCFPTLEALPEVPDCIVVVSPADSVEPTVAEAIRLGIGGVIVFAAGFAETGTAENIARQQRLTDMVRGTGTRLVGPNCIGVMNYVSGALIAFSPQPAESTPKSKSIGIISQSGAIGVAIAQAIDHGTSVSHTLTAGNSCDVDPSDYIAFLAEDPNCHAIACVFEGLSNIDRFLEAARIAWEADKPVIVYKMAVGAAGAEAALSHTGSLAGADAAYRAAFDKVGIVTVDCLEDLVETAMFFAKAPRMPVARGVAVVSTTGGGAIIAADKAEQYGVDLPPFRPETEAFLGTIIPEYGSTKNPADLTAAALNDPEGLRKCGQALFDEPHMGAVVLPHPLAHGGATGRIPFLGDIGAERGKILCAIWLPGWLEGPGAQEAEEHPHAALFHSTDRCMAALAKWHKRADQRLADAPYIRLVSEVTGTTVGGELAAQTTKVVGETEAKSMLARYGVPIPVERLVSTLEEARAAIVEVGLPLVMKIESPDILHKTEAGMVKLGLKTEAEAVAAFQDIMGRAGQMEPRPRISGVVVQPMIQSGLELMIGGRVDPLFGPMILFGFGGVLIELLKDSVSALAPISVDQAKALLPQLRGYALLNGFRGSAPVDIDALARTIAGVSEFLADHAGQVAELDINPLIATERGLVAVDALIIRAEA